MAFIFGKGKKKNDTAQPEVAAAPYEASVDTQGTQTTIAENRKVRQDIERRFNELKDPMFRSKIRRVAEKNQDMIDKHAASPVFPGQILITIQRQSRFWRQNTRAQAPQTRLKREPTSSKYL